MRLWSLASLESGKVNRGSFHKGKQDFYFIDNPGFGKFALVSVGVRGESNLKGNVQLPFTFPSGGYYKPTAKNASKLGTFIQLAVSWD